MTIFCCLTVEWCTAMLLAIRQSPIKEWKKNGSKLSLSLKKRKNLIMNEMVSRVSRHLLSLMLKCNILKYCLIKSNIWRIKWFYGALQLPRSYSTRTEFHLFTDVIHFILYPTVIWALRGAANTTLNSLLKNHLCTAHVHNQLIIYWCNDKGTQS